MFATVDIFQFSNCFAVKISDQVIEFNCPFVFGVLSSLFDFRMNNAVNYNNRNNVNGNNNVNGSFPSLPIALANNFIDPLVTATEKKALTFTLTVTI